MLPTPQIPTCLRVASRRASALLTAATARPLSTTAPNLYRQARVPDSDLPIPSATAILPEIPPYPYGPRPFYHQSNTGLYGAARIRFGNNVSERNEVKTRRKWRPNVHQKRLWSASLGVFVRTRITTRVLRTVDKAGGLDEYLLGRKPQRVKDLGPWGWRLRWRIMQTPALRERLALERAALGLPPKAEEVLRLEAEEALPDGTAAGDALLVETDRMLAADAECELETGGAQDGFMKEDTKPTQ